MAHSKFVIGKDEPSLFLENIFSNQHIAGWKSITVTCFTRLEYLCRLFNVESINILQIKEKFGTLRLYVTFNWPDSPLKEEHIIQADILNEILRSAENRSVRTCQYSGEYGQPRTIGNWRYTLSYEEYLKACKNKGIEPDES